jgi:heptaprenyl diphosphate synthase
MEEYLLEEIAPGDGVLREAASYLIATGGKRLRPQLLFCSFRAMVGNDSDPVPGEAIEAAAAVELVHLASLYHDDVMDEASVRRSLPTVNAKFGVPVAVVAGDYLLARSAEIAARLGPRVSMLLAEALASLCRGQLMEMERAFDTGRTMGHYLETIADKTASLMKAAGEIAAALVGCEGAQIARALTGFCFDFGMAFQVRDDILDLVADEQELGKPPGQDLVEGIYTAPVILALSQEGAHALRSSLGRKLDRKEAEATRALLSSSEGVREALDLLRDFAHKASLWLVELPPSSVAGYLASLARSLTEGLTERCERFRAASSSTSPGRQHRRAAQA